MKGLVKQLVIIVFAMIILYFIFTNTQISQNIGSFISGLFTSIFSKKDEKVIYFEFTLDRDSSYEIKGAFETKINAILKDLEIDKISLIKTSRNYSEISLNCIENCKFKKYFNYIEISGKVSDLNIEDNKIVSKESLNVKINLEDPKNIFIIFKSRSLEICLSNATILVSYEKHKIEQKVYSDCITIDNVIRINFNYDNFRTLISGYASSFKSTFLFNYG